MRLNASLVDFCFRRDDGIMAYYSAFLYDCEMSFNLKNKSYDILPQVVKYIIIDYDYRQRVMPVIYINLNLEPALYNKMVPNQGVGKIS